MFSATWRQNLFGFGAFIADARESVKSKNAADSGPERSRSEAKDSGGYRAAPTVNLTLRCPEISIWRPALPESARHPGKATPARRAAHLGDTYDYAYHTATVPKRTRPEGEDGLFAS